MLVFQMNIKQQLMNLQQLNKKEERIMRELYNSPKAEVVEFDAKDVITTSGILDTFTGEAANTDTGWTGLY